MVEDAATWIIDWVSSRTADDWRRYVWFATVVLIAYRALRWVVRRFLPWVIGRVFIPIAAGLVVAVCLVLILVQGILALSFRPMGVWPPSLVHGLGDAVASVGRGTMRAVPRLAGGPSLLRHTHRLAIWALLAGIAWSAHEVSCEHDPASLWCTRPLSAVTTVGADLWEAGTDVVLGRSST
ncbi:hypothetical protein [Paractinoplanes durhamensis]|uniref:Uncharacterized protein n=1 Tax=Paractinoplanes durhamensis TaxID=113563 RepID=A0ABQ3YRJ9_9ACTN|nr:hypothetical protein [Actinoplanes durhamensis]GIE00163.1 hypothetical protein Adu01nite_15130 [Actinoplanes durhamensis]